MNNFLQNSSLKTIALGAILMLSTALPVHAGGADSEEYKLKDKIMLGAASKYDFTAIDQARHRLYLSRGDMVQVLDLQSGKPLAEIKDTAGVHGIAFAQDLKLGFTSNGKSNSVTVFDLETMKTKSEVKVPGVNPDVIFYDEPSQKLFTFNGKSNDVTVIDATTLKVIASIKATGRPEFAVSDNAGKIYFNIEDHAGINVIDVKSNSLVEKWVLAGCEEPTGLAIDAAHDRLFSTCQNKIMAVTDLKTGKRVADVAIGEHPDAAIFDADTQTIYTSNGGGKGSLTVIKQNDDKNYTVVGNVATFKGAKTMAMDAASKNIYLPTNIDKEFTVLVVGK